MNIRNAKKAVLTTASLLAIMVVPAPLHAQQGASVEAQESNRDVIIVTANRRAESIQDAPLSITAFGGDELANRSITSIEQVGAIAPGVQISTYQGDTSIFIRGIGTPTIIAGTDSSTATYIDGVYISRPAAIGPLFFDIERIEVLRGPQGTLYGRNATGGAVNIVTNRFRVAGALSGPINDAIRARLAFQWEDRDGYATVTRPDDSTERVEDKEDYSIRLTVEADLSPDATLTLNGDYYRADDKANAYFYASAGYADEIPGWYGTREGSQTLPYFGMKNAGRVSAAASRDIFADVPYFNKVENWGLGATLDWDISDYNLKLIGSYRDTNPVSQNEFDLSDAYVNYVGREEDHWQWSGEVQLSSPVDKPFSWIAGAYYFEERNIIDNDIFGNFWEPILIQGFLDLQAADVLPTFPVVFPDSDLCCELHLTTFRAFTPKLDIDFKPSNDVMLYASIQRGFKSGGYNIGSSQRDPFEPEKIWSYEIGARTELLDRALLLNASAFWYDYTNLQAQDSVGNQPIIRNVGKARVRGFEVETVARPTDFFRLEGALTYVDAQFTEGQLTEVLRPAPLTQDPGTFVRDLDGLRLPRAPRWKFSIAGQVEQPLGDAGKITARTEYHWQSKIYFTVFNIDASSQESYGLLRASLGFTSADDRWSVRLFGDNLTGETYFTNQILTGTVYGAEFVGPLGSPSTYGVDLRFNF